MEFVWFALFIKPEVYYKCFGLIQDFFPKSFQCLRYVMFEAAESRYIANVDSVLNPVQFVMFFKFNMFLCYLKQV